MFKRLYSHHAARSIASIVGKIAGGIALALVVTACGKSTPSGDQAILDQVNLLLDTGQCAAALEILQPVYNSSTTDNDIRMAMASVYGCFSGVNVFGLVTDISNANITASASAFWEFLAKEYPSQDPSVNPADKKVESAGFGMDATMASLNAGQVLLPADLFNTTTYNPGSLLTSDRTSDANFYLFFLAMSSIGASENRAGANASGTPKTAATPLPWVTSSTAGMSTEGCEFASAMVNLADAMATLPTTGTLGSTVNTLNNFMENYSVDGFTLGVDLPQLIYAACNYGCQNQVPPIVVPNVTAETAALNTNGGWSATACGSDTGTCANCPLLLRNRNNCAGTPNDQVSCAAAGVINMMNQSILGWH